MMERVNRILAHQTYRQCLSKIRECERTRIFCRHDMGHFLDVARLAWILNIEEQTDVPKELIYAAALLHDIGRHRQYRESIPHEEASAQIAPEILADCGFSQTETEEITEAIRQHRNSAVKTQTDLCGLIYRADKLSRSCFGCEAETACDWKKEKKNLRLIY